MTPTTTAPSTAADRIAELRRQLEQIDVERAADPAALADDVASWTTRDNIRRDRALAIDREIRERTEFGVLLDIEAHRAALATFAAAAAAAKTKLAKVSATRTFPRASGGGNAAVINGVPKLLADWWKAVLALAVALPQGDGDALRVVTREVDEWLAARVAYLQALAVGRDGSDWCPWPDRGEDGGLPPGIRVGAHPAGDAP